MFYEDQDALVDEFVNALQHTAKYKFVTTEFTRALAQRELAHHKKPNEALKACKNKLHQIAGAYFRARPHYDDWLAMLDKASAEGVDAFSTTCRALMARHASTAERVPHLDSFYSKIFEGMQPARVLDLAGGLNALALPFMNLPEAAVYIGVDLYLDLAQFSIEVLCFASRIHALSGNAEAHDLTRWLPKEQYDVALLLKALPPLAQIDAEAPKRLLGSISAKRTIVSFPTRSLGGREKGMAAHYSETYEPIFMALGFTYATVQFPNELVYLLERS